MRVTTHFKGLNNACFKRFLYSICLILWDLRRSRYENLETGEGILGGIEFDGGVSFSANRLVCVLCRDAFVSPSGPVR